MERIYKKSSGEQIFDIINTLLLVITVIFTLYPFIYSLIAAVSSPSAIAKRDILIWPERFQLDSFKMVLKNSAITTGYLNTLFYVSIGTIINIILTIMGAYVLSRRWLRLKNVFMFIVVLTMFINGGLIPSYLVVKDLGMINTRWALILPGAISTWNLIMTRTYFLNSIPDSIEESAKIDGANDYLILAKIVMPLSKPIIAVIALFYAVGHYNSWFSAAIYLRDYKLYPVQLILREILLLSSTEDMMKNAVSVDKELISENIKYATIIVTTLPVLFIYPFVQKYFVQGVMIGAIKG